VRVAGRSAIGHDQSAQKSGILTGHFQFGVAPASGSEKVKLERAWLGGAAVEE
jgi:hypothetical protein